MSPEIHSRPQEPETVPPTEMTTERLTPQVRRETSLVLARLAIAIRISSKTPTKEEEAGK